MRTITRQQRICRVYFFLLLIAAVGLSACSSTADHTRQANNFHSPLYSSEPLNIGIIGKDPVVREEHIEFVPLRFNDLSEKQLEQVDAVFIDQKHLPEAAEAKYAQVYVDSPVPFVFIDSEKVYLAFIDEELSYEDAHRSQSGDYLIGYFNDQYFGADLYGHQKNKQTIQDCYSRIFSFLEETKNTRKITLE